MNLVFNKDNTTITNSSLGDYNINITVFLAYATPPESGLAGTLGIAVTSIGPEYCVICLLNETYGVPKMYSNFSFHQDSIWTKYTG